MTRECGTVQVGRLWGKQVRSALKDHGLSAAGKKAGMAQLRRKKRQEKLKEQADKSAADKAAAGGAYVARAPTDPKAAAASHADADTSTPRRFEGASSAHKAKGRARFIL